MAQNINDNFRLHAPKLLDDKAGPYASVAAALAGVPAYQREQGLAVVVIDEGSAKVYWFRDGIADLDLVEFAAGGGGGYEPKNSIEVDSGELQLVGDSASPGNSKYYGTDETGEKGYHALPEGGSYTPPPIYGEIVNLDKYDGGAVKRIKTDYGDTKYIESRVAYHDSGDAIGQVDIQEIKNDLTEQWIRITYSYDGAHLVAPSTITDILDWTITV